MARNKAFLSPGREAPFSKHGGIHLDHKTVRGPLPFFNPTQARFRVEAEPKRPRPTEKPLPASEVSVPRATINWRSRDNRKGSHEFPCHVHLLLLLYVAFYLPCMCAEDGEKQADMLSKWTGPIPSRPPPSAPYFTG